MKALVSKQVMFTGQVSVQSPNPGKHDNSLHTSISMGYQSDRKQHRECSVVHQDKQVFKKSHHRSCSGPALGSPRYPDPEIVKKLIESKRMSVKFLEAVTREKDLAVRNMALKSANFEFLSQNLQKVFSCLSKAKRRATKKGYYSQELGTTTVGEVLPRPLVGFKAIMSQLYGGQATQNEIEQDQIMDPDLDSEITSTTELLEPLELLEHKSTQTQPNEIIHGYQASIGRTLCPNPEETIRLIQQENQKLRQEIQRSETQCASKLSSLRSLVVDRLSLSEFL